MGGLAGGEGGCLLAALADSTEYWRDSNEAFRGDKVRVLKKQNNNSFKVSLGFRYALAAVASES